MTYEDFLTCNDFDKSNVIYKCKNIKTGKVYIGQTTVSFRKRMIQHMTCGRPWVKCYKSYFDRSLYKYGFENFIIEIIEICFTQEELNIRETYWIQYYNSTNKKYGYNLAIGGKNGNTKPLSEEHKLKLYLSNKGKKRSDKTKELISIAHSAKWKNKEYYKKNIHRIAKTWTINNRKVYQYTTDLQLIVVHNSIADVNEILYGSRRSGSLIRNINNNINKGKFGFYKNGSIWSFLEPMERGSY